IQIQPLNNTAHRNLGYCHLQLGVEDKAIESYIKAIEINDKDWRARTGLGYTYMRSARSKNDNVLAIKAIEQWRLSLTIKPDQPQRKTLRKLMSTYNEEGIPAIQPDFFR
ncbi:MAG: tetratricopeptide repeat protein, partial [Planctomycetota bacterium]